MVGGADGLLRRPALESMGDDAAPDAHIASSRPTDGDAANAGTRAPQQLRTDGRYGRSDAESRADDLRVHQPGCANPGRRTRRRKIGFATVNRSARHGKTRLALDRVLLGVKRAQGGLNNRCSDDLSDLRPFAGGRRSTGTSRYSSRVAASVAQPVWTRLSFTSNTSTNALASNAFASGLSRIRRVTLDVCMNVPAASNREYRKTAE
jgi:hypothetical protein